MASIIRPRTRAGQARRRWLLVTLLAGGLAAGSAELAAACSCGIGEGGEDTREALQRADAAVIGVVTARREAPLAEGGAMSLREDAVALDIRVQRAFKAALGTQVTVHTAANGGLCGLGYDVGDRVSLLLDRRSGRYFSDMCSTVNPKRLEQAARPLPRPRGRGPVRFLLGGRFGGAKMIALDGQGRTLAYGTARGPITRVDVCPGGRHSIELTQVGGRSEIYVRNLRSMLARHRINLREAPHSVSCRTGDAREMIVLMAGWGSNGKADSQILQITGRRIRVVHRATAQWGVIAGRFAWLSSGPVTLRPPDPRSLTRVDLLTGQAQRGVARLAEVPQLTPSPSGQRVAFTNRQGRLCVAAGPGAVIVSARDFTPLKWADDDTLIAHASGPTPIPLRVLDGRLRPVRGLRGLKDLNLSTTSGGRLYAIADDRLLSVRPRGGGVQRLGRVLLGGYSLDAVEGSTHVSARARRAPPR